MAERKSSGERCVAEGTGGGEVVVVVLVGEGAVEAGNVRIPGRTRWKGAPDVFADGVVEGRDGDGTSEKSSTAGTRPHARLWNRPHRRRMSRWMSWAAVESRRKTSPRAVCRPNSTKSKVENGSIDLPKRRLASRPPSDPFGLLEGSVASEHIALRPPSPTSHHLETQLSVAG